MRYFNRAFGLPEKNALVDSPYFQGSTDGVFFSTPIMITEDDIDMITQIVGDYMAVE